MADPLVDLRRALFRVEGKLDALLDHLDIVIQQGETMSVELDRLEASVTAEKTVVASAVTLLGQLAQLIRDAGTDPTRLKALADEVDAQKTALAAAVTANTPHA